MEGLGTRYFGLCVVSKFQMVVFFRVLARLAFAARTKGYYDVTSA